jgi:hypothetical protein
MNKIIFQNIWIRFYLVATDIWAWLEGEHDIEYLLNGSSEWQGSGPTNICIRNWWRSRDEEMTFFTKQ